MFLDKLHNFNKRLKQWKPIHLCWLFEKYGLPVPPYFIGGTIALDQRNYILGDDDNADPDLCTWDVENTPRTSQAKEVNFMVRLQVANDGGLNTNTIDWELYYNYG